MMTLPFRCTVLVALCAPAAAPPVPASAQPGAASPATVLQLHTQNGSWRALALEQLARAGQQDALASLKQDAARDGTPAQRPALLALARLGDAAAAARLGSMMGGDPDLETVRALEQSRTVAAGPALVRALGASSQAVRAEAAVAIGRIGYAKGAGALRAALDDTWGEVRAAASAGLLRLGDTSLRAVVEGRLETPLREIQLAAADAWAPEQDGKWVAEIEPMLRNPTAEVRHAAAERLAVLRRPQVMAVLQADLEPDSPDATREEAARLASEHAGAADAPWLQRALADPLPAVQIYAAGALLRSRRH